MDHGDASELLHRHRLRSTPQRRAILGAFRGTATEHLSAEEVLARAAREVADIGRGTVYATLAELSELGLLAAVGTVEPVRYETNLAPHDHFHCRLCLRLFDVDLGGSTLRHPHLEDFVLDSVSVRAEGICRDCGAYLRGLGDGAAGIRERPALDSEAVAALACARVDSPLGRLGIAASEDGIVRLAFDDHADFDLIDARSRSRRGPAAARMRLRTVAGTLERYFDGDQAPSADVIDWSLPGIDRRTTLEAAQRIPYAESLSYERLGERLASYDCGLLIGSNPLALLIPCHRVSRGSERPAAYVGGAERLRFLHDLESGAGAL